MTGLQTIGYGKTYTHRQVLWQDIPNSHLDFTASALYQDFTLFNIPANHMIFGVKMSVLVNFDAGGPTSTMYVGNEHTILPSPMSSPYVSNVNDCFGVASLMIPSGDDPTYGYGSFRWFNFSSPGSTNTISTAYCIPKRTDAQNIIARVLMSSSTVSSMLTGAIEITVEYGPF